MNGYYCSEKLKFFVIKHHNYSFMNDKIMKEIQGVSCSRDYKTYHNSDTNIKALQTSGPIKSHALSLLRRWIKNMIVESRILKDPIISDYWMAFYKKGDYTVPHYHLPALYSFNYFIKTPKGSSPFVLTTSKVEIEPEEGKLVIFPSSLVHEVPKNECDDRIIFAGNIWEKRLDFFNDEKE
jgi:hypothetical protein